MANSALVGRKIMFPKQLILQLKQSSPVFSTQVQNFLDQGYMEYYDMKNYLRDFPTIPDEEKPKYGGYVLFKWVRGMLNTLRNRVENIKKGKDLAGKSNAFIKTHNKTPARTGHTKTTI